MMETNGHLSPLELFSLETNAAFTYDANGRTIKLAEPWDGTVPAPRFFLGRTIDGKTITRYRYDVDASIVNKLESLAKDETAAAEIDDEPKHKKQYQEILGANESYSGPHWLVPAYNGKEKLYSKNENPGDSELIPVLITRQNINRFSLKGFEWLFDEIDVAEPCAGLIIEGRLVSQCRSVRRSPAAHEAGLETVPDFRGKGFAAIVTRAWAAAVREIGALPFYSTSWNNNNSRNVAKKLGLYFFGSNFSIK